MATAVFSVQVDSKRDNSFSGVSDDITQYVLNASWNNGLANAFDDFAPPSQLTITLDNIGGEFTQDTIGTEALTNGSFSAWTANNPDSWTVTGESGTDPEVSQVGTSETHGGGGTGLANLYTSSAALSIAQNVLTIGTRYKATLTIDGLLSIGGVVIKNNGAAVSPVYHLAGTKTVYFTAAAADFMIATDGAANVTLQSVSCKPVSLYAGAVTRGALIRIRATFAGQTSQLYIGKIRDVSFAPGNLGQKTLTINAEDPMNALMQTDYQPSLITDATVDQGLAEIFDKATYGWPYAHSGWLLGVEGSSELGTTTVLYQDTLANLETGSTVLAFLGSASDNGHGVAAQAIARDLIVTEAGGRFWFDTRAGQFKFTNRHHDILNSTASLGTFADFDSAPPLLYGDTVYNDVTVNYQPRGLGVPGTAVWQAKDIIDIPPGQIKKMTCRYFDVVNNTDAKVSAIDVITPERYTDFVVEIHLPVSTDGGLTTTDHPPTTLVTLPVTDPIKFNTVTKINTDHTQLFYVELHPGATSAELTIHRLNRGHRDNYVTGLRIRGTPLYTYDKRAAHAQDGDSIRANGIQKKILDLPQVSDDSFADGLAAFVLTRFKDPLTRLPSMTFIANKTDTRMSAALTRQIGDRITVSDSFTAHTADYIVIGERHQLTAGGEHTLSVTWTLEPANTTTYWKLGVPGYSELGTTTRLAF